MCLAQYFVNDSLPSDKEDICMLIKAKIFISSEAANNINKDSLYTLYTKGTKRYFNFPHKNR